jgi:ABC-type antimicrobial peptide transport system permease subunit
MENGFKPRIRIRYDIRMSDRPTGVTIISILYTLGSVGSLFFALGSLLFGYMFSIILLAAVIAVIVISYGMWEGLTWAWYLSIAGYVINIIIGARALLFLQSPIAIVSILLNIAFIFYFLQEHVKKFFEV